MKFIKNYFAILGAKIGMAVACVPLLGKTAASLFGGEGEQMGMLLIFMIGPAMLVSFLSDVLSGFEYFSHRLPWLKCTSASAMLIAWLVMVGSLGSPEHALGFGLAFATLTLCELMLGFSSAAGPNFLSRA